VGVGYGVVMKTTEQQTMVSRVSVQAREAYVSTGVLGGEKSGRIVFVPTGTNYQHHLEFADAGEGGSGLGGLREGSVVRGLVRLKARKVYTVVAGGNFVAPILGTPRTIQGEVVGIGEGYVVVQAGAKFVVELPEETGASVELGHGAIEVGTRVNVVAMPGAWFERVE
jgi:hypothetical protein